MFVADFLGVSNLMDADRRTAARTSLPGDGGRLRARRAARQDRRHAAPSKVMIRPERVQLEEPHESSGANRIPGMVERARLPGQLRAR